MLTSDPILPALENVSIFLEAFLEKPELFRGNLLRGSGPTFEFEQLLAQRCDFPFCVSTGSASSALLGLAITLELSGRKVLIPQGHWEGTAASFRTFGVEVVEYNHAEIVDTLEAHPDTKLVVFGEAVPNLQLFNRSNRPFLILEDSSRIPESLDHLGQGSVSDIQIMSFGPGKPLSLGEGGAALFRKRELYEIFVRVTQHPERVEEEFSTAPHIPPICLHSRIHPISAILGVHLLNIKRLGIP